MSELPQLPPRTLQFHGTEKSLSRGGDLAFLGVRDIRNLTVHGTLTAAAVTEYFLDRIHRYAPLLNCFTTILWNRALEEASERDAARSRGEKLGPLHGVPIVIKDENDVEGTPTTFGGYGFPEIKTADSVVVKRLRDAGAVILGKTTMPEFGIWPYTESERFGITRNPWNLDRSPAGSSGGTAAAVAAGLCTAGIGGDGGGSIRLPSSWCGLVGLKTQRGRASVAPNPNLWRSLGVVGPLTRTVEDSAIINLVIAGATAGVDQYTALPWDAELMSTLNLSGRTLRVGVSTASPTPMTSTADSDAVAAVEHAAEHLRMHGHHVEYADPDYPDFSDAVAPQLIGGVSDEAARASDFHALETRTREVVALGKSLDPSIAGESERAGAGHWNTLKNGYFSRFDVLVMPTTKSSAVPVGQLSGVDAVGASVKAGPESSFTSPWNACGNPAVSVPVARTDQGLPIGVQLVGTDASEGLLMALASQLESTIRWNERRPSAFG